MKPTTIRSFLPALVPLTLVAALVVACGDDGGSSSGPVGARRVASIDEAGPCNAKNDEETIFVGEEKEP